MRARPDQVLQLLLHDGHCGQSPWQPSLRKIADLHLPKPIGCLQPLAPCPINPKFSAFQPNHKYRTLETALPTLPATWAVRPSGGNAATSGSCPYELAGAPPSDRGGGRAGVCAAANFGGGGGGPGAGATGWRCPCWVACGVGLCRAPAAGAAATARAA
eukprot:358705-Chlamydomonas_euryale.AAC.4